MPSCTSCGHAIGVSKNGSSNGTWMFLPTPKCIFWYESNSFAPKTSLVHLWQYYDDPKEHALSCRSHHQTPDHDRANAQAAETEQEMIWEVATDNGLDTDIQEKTAFHQPPPPPRIPKSPIIITKQPRLWIRSPRNYYPPPPEMYCPNSYQKNSKIT